MGMQMTTLFKTDFVASYRDRTFEDQARLGLEACATKVGKWMTTNRLKMNNTKTEVINFGSWQQLRKVHNTHFDINGCPVEIAKSIKYLGSIFRQPIKTGQAYYYKVSHSHVESPKVETDQTPFDGRGLPCTCTGTCNIASGLCQCHSFRPATV